MSIEDKHFCLMPWVHVHVTQYGTVTPCCAAPWQEEESFGNINRQGIDAIWNSEAIKAFRLKLKNNEPDHRCVRCYKQEEAGLYSLRTATNKDYAHQLQRVINTAADGSISEPPVYFDVRFSNFCNFRCRICGPWSSSSWFNDGRELGWVGKDVRLSKAIEDEDAFFAQFKTCLPQVEEIYFAGGEPMLMEQHYRVLDLLLELGLTKTYLRYNTNFSVFEFKGKSIFEYWKQFENIFVCASLDDNYERGELQRKEQKWTEVVARRKQLMHECPHIDFMLAPTISLLNVFTLPAFHREWTEMGLVDVSEIFPSILQEPAYYNIKALPAGLKQKVRATYEAHHHWMLQQPTKDEAVRNLVAQEFLNIVRFMEAEDRSGELSNFKHITKQLDALRGEDSKAIITKLSLQM